MRIKAISARWLKEAGMQDTGVQKEKMPRRFETEPARSLLTVEHACYSDYAIFTSTRLAWADASLGRRIVSTPLL